MAFCWCGSGELFNHSIAEPLDMHHGRCPLQFDEERWRVIYKRPTDLALIQDVPICCNLLIANVFDEGLV
jgi:hypothetical protein